MHLQHMYNTMYSHCRVMHLFGEKLKGIGLYALHFVICTTTQSYSVINLSFDHTEHYRSESLD